MSDMEKQSLLLEIKSQLASVEEDGDSSNSSWSPVSKTVPESINAPSSPSMIAEMEACSHKRVTTRGSNHFLRQVRCLDCGLVLHKEPTRNGHKKK